MTRLWRVVGLAILAFLTVGFYFVQLTDTYSDIYSQAKISDYLDKVWCKTFKNQSKNNEELKTTADSPKVNFLSTQQNFTTNLSIVINGNITYEKQCNPVKQLIFAKTHKTGSTTLQNIIFRFGERHRLMFVLPKSGAHFFNLRAHFVTSMAELYKHVGNVGFDIFAAHSRWNGSEVSRLVPAGYRFTILRDPVDTFESFFSYMNVDKKVGMDINQFAWTFATLEGVRALDISRGRNRQLYDLGLEEDQMESEEEVMEKIDELDSEFDLVFILERFEEGLVIFADQLCWPLEDVQSVRLNSRTEEYVSKITKESRDILTDWLWADHLLYNHFLQKHKLSVEKYGAQKMIEEVGRLRSLNLDLTAECSETVSSDVERAEKIFKPNHKKIRPVVPQKHKRWCRPYYRTEIAYTKMIRRLNRLTVRTL